MGKGLGVGTAGTAVLNWPKGYSIPYNIVFRNKKPAEAEEKERWGTGFWGGHCSDCLGISLTLGVVSRCLCITWGVCLFVFPLFFPHMLSCLYPDPWIFSLFFVFSPHAAEEEGLNERLYRCLAAGRGQPTTLFCSKKLVCRKAVNIVFLINDSLRGPFHLQAVSPWIARGVWPTEPNWHWWGCCCRLRVWLWTTTLNVALLSAPTPTGLHVQNW